MATKVFDWEEEWEWNGGENGEEVNRKLDEILDRKNNLNINNSFAEIIDFNYDLPVSTIEKLREGSQ